MTNQQLQGRADGYYHKAPTCRGCGLRVKTVRWRRFKNGTMHLVWFCCGKQAAGNPLPKHYARLFDVVPEHVAHARLTLESGEGW